MTISPFPSDRQSADVILRTVDHVDFYAHKIILAHSSTIFHAMFSLPQPTSTEPTPSPSIVDITETARTLETILRICYPLVKEKSRPFEDIEPALRAALKYDMPLPTDVLTDELCAEVPRMPLRVWAVACRTGLEPVARSAAEFLLAHSGPDVSDHLQHMEGVVAADYFRLRQFHRVQGQTAPTFTLLSPSRANILDGDGGIQEHQDSPYCQTVPYPDLRCLSSDGVEIKAHRCVLAMASPILAARLSAAADSSSSNDTEAVSGSTLTFEECGQVLARLLDTCCYLREDRLPSAVSEIATLIVSAQKYEMTKGLEVLGTHWDRIMKEHPLDAYFTAVRSGWAGRAKRAAMLLLDVDSLETIYASSMETASIQSYQRLLTYYDKCRSAVEDEISAVRAEWQSSQTNILLKVVTAQTVALTAAFQKAQMPAPAAIAPAFHVASIPPTIAAGEESVLWSLDSFLNLMASVKGPSGKVSAAHKMVHEYLKWRRAKESLSCASREEANDVLRFADNVPTRLHDAIMRVVLHVD